MENVIVQTLKTTGDALTIAEKYYELLSTVNSIRLTQREVQLVAFTAIRGSMSYANVRNEFCKKYSTTTPTINNIISKLKKVGLLIKKDGKIIVNPIVALDFNKNIKVEIKLFHETSN